MLTVLFGGIATGFVLLVVSVLWMAAYKAILDFDYSIISKYNPISGLIRWMIDPSYPPKRLF